MIYGITSHKQIRTYIYSQNRIKLERRTRKHDRRAEVFNGGETLVDIVPWVSGENTWVNDNQQYNLSRRPPYSDHLTRDADSGNWV